MSTTIRKRRIMQIIAVGLLCFLLLSCAAWAIATFCFAGADHSRFDSPRPASVGVDTTESSEHAAIAKMIANEMENTPSEKGRQLIFLMRKQLNERGESTKIDSEVRAVDVNGIPAEWVIAPNVVPGHRLLYIHGGAYVMGSPKSHRPIASRFSEATKAAVLSIDYRLMPESKRIDGIEDCRNAYRWIMENGPDGPSQVRKLIVAGDSSGGNMVLSTIAWARDQRLRAADAVVALSPQTDVTLSSPSLRTNVDTDVMQGKSFGPVVRLPHPISLWVVYLMHGINPSDPIVSPLLGDLSNLPPTLLQVSEAEMFLDDSVRYANKATAQGSVVVLQTWPSTMHAWHAFDAPESDEAFEKIEEFIVHHVPQ